jgi:hypothetical protein
MHRRTFLYALAAASGTGTVLLVKAHSQAIMSPEFPLHVSVETRNDQLLVYYEVKNASSRDLDLQTRAVINQSVQEAPGVEFERESRTLSISKLPNVVEGTLLYEPIRALVTPVRAGQRFVDKVQVALPAREFRYGMVSTESCQERLYRGLRFSVGYIWSGGGTTERMERIGAVEVIQPIFPLVRQLDTGVLKSPVMPLDIPVVECTLNE